MSEARIELTELPKANSFKKHKVGFCLMVPCTSQAKRVRTQQRNSDDHGLSAMVRAREKPRTAMTAHYQRMVKPVFREAVAIFLGSVLVWVQRAQKLTVRVGFRKKYRFGSGSIRHQVTRQPGLCSSELYPQTLALDIC